ncbi:MAG: hypothetical protein DHS20C13_30150 [Thermodesulfobacteriota bacterium]|nr:MAG: hypothetical protein DHS20C13_30150 [Thermodesulfobacteriota bacterium]
MNKILKIAVLSFAIIFFSGCTIRMVDFTVISTKNVNIPSVAKGPRVTGEDCVLVVIFPLGIPNMKEAIDRAIEKAGPEYDALVDGVVYRLNHSFLFGQVCFKVEGTPINTKASMSFNDLGDNKIMHHSKRFISHPIAPETGNGKRNGQTSKNEENSFLEKSNFTESTVEKTNQSKCT